MCRFSGVNFFPERGESTGPAKALCAVCPAQDACLAFAVAEGITDGVWGGTSPQERREMRKPPGGVAVTKWSQETAERTIRNVTRPDDDSENRRSDGLEGTVCHHAG